MKKRSVMAAAAGMALMTSGALAVPYASKVRLGATGIGFESGTSINYHLNSAASSVTIEVYSAGQTPGTDTPVASFAGTTTQGANSVAWDGTDNNSGGTFLAVGNDYFVSINVSGTETAGWAEFASNRSGANLGPTATLNTLFAGFSGNDIFISHEQDSDLYGLIVATSSYNGTVPPHKAAVVFNTDLSITAGDDGFASRVFRQVNDGQSPAVGTSQDTWGTSPDPDDPELIWVTGQDPAGVGHATRPASACVLFGTHTGGSLDTNLSNADSTGILDQLIYPRNIAVLRRDSSTKDVYLTRSNAQIVRFAVNSSNVITQAGGGQNILDATSLNAAGNRYSKSVRFDAAGNLYWVTRDRTGAATGEEGRLYRWNAADVNTAVTGSLTEALAAWVVQFPAGAARGADVAIDPTNGDVYVANGVGSPRGVYLVGNTATANIGSSATPVILTSAELKINYETIGTGWTTSTFGHGMEFDAVGNLYVTERSNEQIRAFSPGGASTLRTNAPTSQDFDIVSTADATGWGLYR